MSNCSAVGFDHETSVPVKCGTGPWYWALATLSITNYSQVHNFRGHVLLNGERIYATKMLKYWEYCSALEFTGIFD